MSDKKSGDALGYFYMDLFERDGKYGHAMAMPFNNGVIINGEKHLPSMGMVVNFSKPSEGNPTLLSHSEVETFFHEFGHIMHSICNEATHSIFRGTNVEVDFSELPSQMLENWMHDKNILKKIGKHHKTGKEMPDELIDSMERYKMS